MLAVSARGALDYATRDEMLKLYGVLVGGWVLTFGGQVVSQTVRNPVVSLVGVLVSLAGVLAVLVGIVAIAHKVLVESRPAE